MCLNRKAKEGTGVRGIAVLDRQPGSDAAAVWITSRGLGLDVANVNAVVLDLASDPDATEKVRALTRCCVVLATNGTTLDGWPIEGEPFVEADLDSLLAEIAEHQQRITDAVKAYKSRTHSKTLAEPLFPPVPNAEDFAPDEDTASRRAFMLANYVGRVWGSWLKTDEERRRRTVQPKTGATPWVMPDDMNEQTTPDFPPAFASRVIEQPLV